MTANELEIFKERSKQGKKLQNKTLACNKLHLINFVFATKTICRALKATTERKKIMNLWAKFYIF